MQTFKLSTEGLTKRFLIRMLPSILIILIVVTAMEVIKGNLINLSQPASYIPQLVLFPCLIVFSLWWGVKKQKKIE